MASIAIRREDKNEFEARTPLTPDDVRALVAQGVRVVVQPAPRRVFRDDEFRAAGAVVDENISACEVVLGVKEIPTARLESGRTYMFFSHTIKGQPYNMPMLAHMLAQRCNLLDYECVTDDRGLRLIAFGKQAGQAGMIDTLWALGLRLAAEGVETPLLDIKQALSYASLEEAESAVRRAGERIAREGWPDSIAPVVIAVLGNGRVSSGAWEILDLLPVRETAPEELPALVASRAERHRVVKVVMPPERYVRRKSDGGFDFDEYIAKPDIYEPTLEAQLDKITTLVNGIYWDARYPRLVTRAWLADAYANGHQPRLRVIGDISCDIRGSLESTVRATTPANPLYLYDPVLDDTRDTLSGPGPLVLAVDNLPCELPREASMGFGAALMPFVPALVEAHASGRLDPEKLPSPLRRALIAADGALTPPFAKLAQHLPR